jgi:Zn-dependent protease with chaperone function
MSSGKQGVGFQSDLPKQPASTRSRVDPAARTPARPRAEREKLTGIQLATAFDGKLERGGTSVGYQIGILLVAGLMILLPLVYVAIIAGAGWLTARWAVVGGQMFHHVRGRGALLLGVVYLAPLVAGGLLVLSMVLQMFWRSQKEPKPLWVDRREQPLLYAYVERLCAVMGAPKPTRIDVIATSNASAHIDNGIFGLLSRRMVLTIGLPLAATMDLKQFTGVLAHEVGHFSQGIFMRLSYAVQLINGWFARMAWGRSGIDDLLDGMMADEPHWSFLLIALFSKLVLFVARLVMMLMAVISQALCMNLSRQAEFDADRRAARIVGSDALAGGLQILPAVGAAGAMAVDRAEAGWTKRELPDDLILLTSGIQQQLPQSLKDKLDASILSADTSWFDTHPPLFKRIAALRKARFAGVMTINAPATELFKEFDELSKLATIDFYDSIVGKALKPEYLVTTVLPRFGAAT